MRQDAQDVQLHHLALMTCAHIIIVMILTLCHPSIYYQTGECVYQTGIPIGKVVQKPGMRSFFS
jgi:hypothetical protein